MFKTGAWFILSNTGTTAIILIGVYYEYIN